MENLYSENSVNVVVELPSRGKLYDGKLPGGEVKIRAMTARDEKLLYGGKGSVTEKMDALLSACVKLPPEITTQDLLVSDRFFLLIKIRMLSLGSEYAIQVKCPDCDQQFIKNFDFSELRVRYYEEEENPCEPFYVQLPVLDKKLGFRMLRGKDEKAIHKFSHSRAVRTEELGDPSYTYTLSRVLVSLDDKPVSQQDALLLVENMVSKDVMTLRHAMEEKNCEVDTTLFIECPRCNFLMEETLPFNDEFFRPKRKGIRGSPFSAI